MENALLETRNVESPGRTQESASAPTEMRKQVKIETNQNQGQGHTTLSTGKGLAREIAVKRD